MDHERREHGNAQERRHLPEGPGCVGVHHPLPLLALLLNVLVQLLKLGAVAQAGSHEQAVGGEWGRVRDHVHRGQGASYVS